MNNVLDMPLSKLFGITKATNEKYLLKLDFKKEYLNHINTLHASAIYSLAEISGGYFLYEIFPQYTQTTTPILRNSCMKYKKQCNSNLYSKTKLKNSSQAQIIQQLEEKKRVLFTIEVKLYDEFDQLTVTSEFDWLVSKN